MASYSLTPDAIADIDDIWNFIAKDSPRAADSVEDEIFAACGRLSESPLQGQVRTEITARRVRFWTIPAYPNYMIVYRPEAPIQIIRVLHGKRDLKNVLGR